MSLLRHETITVNRDVNSYTDKGRPQTDSSSTFDTEANIQPLQGNEILQLTDGDRERSNFWCHTDVELKVNDEVIRDGIKFEVHPVEDWSKAGVLVHFRSRIMSKEQQ